IYVEKNYNDLIDNEKVKNNNYLKIDQLLKNLNINLDNNETINKLSDISNKINELKELYDNYLKVDQIMKNLDIHFTPKTSLDEKLTDIVSCTKNLNKF
ncbi:8462_t:CDS:1, partial [Cetraspora pellucida]